MYNAWWMCVFVTVKNRNSETTRHMYFFPFKVLTITYMLCIGITIFKELQTRSRKRWKSFVFFSETTSGLDS